MRQLCQVAISGFALLLLQAAANPIPGGELWEHVNKTCLTAECDELVSLQQIKQIERYMNHTADPCVNFHAYACGNWRKEHANGTTMMKLVNDKFTSVYEQLFEDILDNSNNIVESPVSAYDVVVEKVVKYYSVCKAGEFEQPRHLRGFMAQMRHSNIWALEDYNWLVNLAHLARYGHSEHFLATVVNQTNSTHHRLLVQAHNKYSAVALDISLYDDILKDFTNRTYAQLVLQFAQLEENLSAIVQSHESDKCAVELYTFAELLEICNEIDWPAYIGTQLGRKMLPTDTLWVEQIALVKHLARYINNEDQELLLLYSLTRFLNYLQDLPHNMMGAVPSGEWGTHCVRHMRKVLYLPLLYIYEQNFYQQIRADSDRVVHLVFNELKAEFMRSLSINKMQFPADTVDFLLLKISSLKINLGNLPLGVTEDFYKDYVQEMNFTNNFYHNNLQTLETYYRHDYKLTELQNSSSPWTTFQFQSPEFSDNLDASPYYHCICNTIFLPHDYLQSTFYDYRFWPALLYGDLASTLGHEMIHAVDSFFIHYDHVGRWAESYRQVESNPNYLSNMACLTNGTNLINERVADVSGTRLALNVVSRKDEKFLRQDGKLFFLQLAQFFCGETDAETFRAEDPYHDQDSLRLNYTLANMPEFAMVFDCAPHSPMNPSDRCELW